MEWQPIETAPHEGEYLVYDSLWDQIAVVTPFTMEGRVRWWSPVMGGHDGESMERCTHWMPLPKAPQVKTPSPTAE